LPAGSGVKPFTSTDVSAQITSDVPVIVERALYLSTPTQVFGAGQDSAGVTATSLDWFFAEGATGAFFDFYLLLANPYDTAAEVTVRYLLRNGTTYTKAYTVAANARSNIWVDGEQIPAGSGVRPLANTSVAAVVTVTNGVPIVAERSMWWGDATSWYESHNTPGATTTGTVWALAEGEQGGTRGTDTYVLVANTSATAGRVRATLLYEDGGAPDVEEFDLLPNSRFNLHPGWASDLSPHFLAAANRRFGVLVESLPVTGGDPAQIVVERSMYWSVDGVFWAAGTAALGTKIR
jgi:hypothetical protein